MGYILVEWVQTYIAAAHQSQFKKNTMNHFWHIYTLQLGTDDYTMLTQYTFF